MLLAQSRNGEGERPLLRQTRVRITDPSLLDEFVQHLRRSGCEAAAAEVQAAHGDGSIVDADVPAALDEDQARMEFDLYLRVCEATHPGSGAQIIS